MTENEDEMQQNQKTLKQNRGRKYDIDNRVFRRNK
jgi:hypothetical protein